jgi:hypothetical protein
MPSKATSGEPRIHQKRPTVNPEMFRYREIKTRINKGMIIAPVNLVSLSIFFLHLLFQNNYSFINLPLTIVY